MKYSKLGREIAFLGVDGSGKSTSAKALHRELTNRGYISEVLSWRSLRKEKKDSASINASLILDELHAASHRIIWGAADYDVSTEPPLFPESSHGILNRSFLHVLGEKKITGNNCYSLISASLVELSADLAYRQMVVEQKLKKNIIVISDSYGIKPVVKLLLSAKFIEPFKMDIFQQLEKVIISLYTSICRPDIGIYMDMDGQAAWKRRMNDRKGQGLVEDLSIIGRGGANSFVQLQDASRDLYSRIAKDPCWISITPGALTSEHVNEQVNNVVLRRLELLDELK